MNIFPKWFWVIVIVALIGIMLWYFSSIIICIALAGILSLVLQPLYSFFKRIKILKKSVSNEIAAVLSMGSLILLFTLLFLMIIPLVISQISMVSNIDLYAVMNDLQQPISQIELWLVQYGFMGKEQHLQTLLTEKVKALIMLIDIPSIAGNFFTGAGNFFFIYFSTLFITFFFLSDENLFQRFIAVFIPDDQEAKLHNTFIHVRSMLFKYCIAILIQIICIVFYVTLLLFFLGVENAFLIGILAGLLNVVPYLGPVIALVIGMVLATIAHLQMGTYTELPFIIIKLAGVFFSMQFLDNNFLQPYIFSKSTNAHPLEIFIVIVVAGTIGGIMGMVAAVPAYTIIRIIVFEFFGDNKIIQKLRAL